MKLSICQLTKSHTIASASIFIQIFIHSKYLSCQINGYFSAIIFITLLHPVKVVNDTIGQVKHLTKMKALKALFLTTLVVILIIGLGSCKKDKDTTQDKPSLTFTKSGYAPMEVAILQSDKDFTGDDITAKVDGENVAIYRMDSNRIALLIPVKTAGTYTISIDGDMFSNNKPSFTINPYTPIADKDQAIATFTTNANNRVAELNHLKTLPGWTISAQNINEVVAMQNTLQQAIVSATPQEKEQLAYFIQANHLLETPLESIAFTDSFYSKAEMDAGDELNRLNIKLTATYASMVVTVAAMGALAYAPEGVFTKIGAVAAGLALMIEVNYSNSLTEKIAECTGKAAEFNFSGTPEFTSSNSGISIMDNLKFRTVVNTDLSENSNIKSIVENINKLKALRTKLNAMLSKVKNWFSDVPAAISGTAAELKATPLFKNFYARQDYLTVKNVTNSNIVLNIVNIAGESKVKAISTLSTSTNFQFDIVYKHPDLGNTVTKTINAKFVPDSINTLQKLIQYGPWKTTIYTNNVPDGYLIYAFATNIITRSEYDNGGTLVGNPSQSCLVQVSETQFQVTDISNCSNVDETLNIISITSSLLKIEIGGDVVDFVPQ